MKKSIFNKCAPQTATSQYQTFTQYQTANIQNMSRKYPFLSKSQVRAKLKQQWEKRENNKNSMQCNKSPVPSTTTVKKSLLTSISTSKKKNSSVATTEEESFGSAHKPLRNDYRSEEREMSRDADDEISSSDDTSPPMTVSDDISPPPITVSLPLEIISSSDEVCVKKEVNGNRSKSTNGNATFDSTTTSNKVGILSRKGVTTDSILGRESKDSLQSTPPIRDLDIDFKISPFSVGSVSETRSQTKLLTPIVRRPRWGGGTPDQYNRSALRDITDKFNTLSSADAKSEGGSQSSVESIKKNGAEKSEEISTLGDEVEENEDEDDDDVWNRLLMKSEANDDDDVEDDSGDVAEGNDASQKSSGSELCDSDKENQEPTTTTDINANVNGSQLAQETNVENIENASASTNSSPSQQSQESVADGTDLITLFAAKKSTHPLDMKKDDPPKSDSGPVTIPPEVLACDDAPTSEPGSATATTTTTSSRRSSARVRSNVKMKRKAWEDITVVDSDEADSGFLTEMFKKPDQRKKFKTPSIARVQEKGKDLFDENNTDFFN